MFSSLTKNIKSSIPSYKSLVMPKCHFCDKEGWVRKCDGCGSHKILCGWHCHTESTLSDWGDGGDTKVWCWDCDGPRRRDEERRREQDAQRRAREQKKEELMREYERKEAEKKELAKKSAMERASKQFEEWKTQNPEWESQQREKFFNEMEQKWEKHLDGLKKEQMDIFFMYQNNL